MESERKISVKQGEYFAAKYGMKFCETSAKESTNVSEAFITMTRDIINPNNEKNIFKSNNKNNYITLNRNIVLKKYLSY